METIKDTFPLLKILNLKDILTILYIFVTDFVIIASNCFFLKFIRSKPDEGKLSLVIFKWLSVMYTYNCILLCCSTSKFEDLSSYVLLHYSFAPNFHTENTDWPLVLQCVGDVSLWS